MPFVIDRSKFEKRPSVSKVFALFNWGSWNLLDFPFVLNKDYLDLEFNAATKSAWLLSERDKMKPLW